LAYLFPQQTSHKVAKVYSNLLLSINSCMWASNKASSSFL
jgi:hypothetical protein